MEEKIKEGEGIKDEIKEVLPNAENGERILPVIPLRGKVLYPRTILNFDVGRPASVNAVDSAEGVLFIAAQKNAFIDAPRKADILKVGVIARIKQIIRVQGGSMKLCVEAVSRAKIKQFCDTKDYFTAVIAPAPYEQDADPVEIEAYFRVAKNAFYEYTLFDKRINKDMLATITALSDPNDFMDNAMSVVNFKEEDCQRMLTINGTVERLKAFDKLFTTELEIAKVEKKIAGRVRGSIDKSQKEFYLREQLKAIHTELGDDPEEGDELKERILAKKLPAYAEEKVLKELSRLDKINPSSPEYSVILNYIDWVLDLPFTERTEDNDDLAAASEILNADHFGLDKVKERIVEYLAVLHLTKEIKGPILCFVGPPGVGKTSVATSIARSLGRKFVRMSLGGVKDEAEIRGHRKTYVGAMPGRIITGLKTAGSNNPVFLLDEIDKLSSDIHGDPASALLEVLDPEQNATFRDRFLEIPFDLSKVMFITTANSVDTIPYPLLDRMEIIELSGYTDEEKFQIAKRYLIPKQIKNNGLTEKKIEIEDAAVTEIIEGYTMEAGVRNLEREIGSVVRKVAVRFAERPRLKKQVVKAADIPALLGVRKRSEEDVSGGEVGACTGLAWTSVGGTTLTIEAALMRGKGEILLTGKLGDVMKESARAAISYIRAHAEKYKIDSSRFENTDIHIHVPEGATPKDGPSAGVTMATAILSAFTNKPVRKGVAMTGEITLRGKVLPIGGLKEKSLAAFRKGIKTVVIPRANEKDLADIPEEVKKAITFVPVTEADEVFTVAIGDL